MKKFFRTKFFTLIPLFLGALFIHASVASAATGTIVTGFQNAEFLNPSYGSVNFKTTNGTPVIVSDTDITGDAWGDDVGWINLNPTQSGVTNTCGGTLGGYAWGQNTGWINFAPTNGGVTVDPSSGEFDGDAWAQNMGWLHFECPGTACVKTTWTCSSPTPPPPPPPSGGGGSGGSISASCNLSANTVNITQGQSLTLSWTSNLNSVTTGSLTSSSTSQATTISSTNGSIPVTPPVTTTYTVTLKGNGAAGTAMCNVTINVTSAPVTCTDLAATNFGGTLPCTYPSFVCTNPSALNFGAALPCVYPVGTATCQDTSATNIGSPLPCMYPTSTCTPGDPGCPIFPVIPSLPTMPGTPSGGGCVGPLCAPVIPSTTGGTSTGGTLLSIAEVLALLGLLAGLVANAPGFIFHGQNMILSLFAIKKKFKEWGVVYDSVTKRPLDPAYVSLRDMMGNEVASSITDIDGRYGFLVNPGTYRLMVGKTNYVFPSKRLEGKASDDVYDHLYFGGDIEIKNSEEVITKNVPMDPVQTDWNEIAKKQTNRFAFFKNADILFFQIMNVLFWVGFAFAIYAAYVSPATWNFIVLGFYSAIAILSLIGLGGRKFGIIKTSHGDRLAYAVVHVYNAALGTEVARRVANAWGQYYCILPKGRYYFTIDKRNPDGTYTKVYTSHPVKIIHGILKKSIEAFS